MVFHFFRQIDNSSNNSFNNKQQHYHYQLYFHNNQQVFIIIFIFILIFYLINSQNSIGWDQFFCGRISTDWQKVYQVDLENNDTGLYRPTTEKWGTKILELNFEFVLSCWQVRNDLEYDDNDKDSDTEKNYSNFHHCEWGHEQIVASEALPDRRLAGRAVREHDSTAQHARPY